MADSKWDVPLPPALGNISDLLAGLVTSSNRLFGELVQASLLKMGECEKILQGFKTPEDRARQILYMLHQRPSPSFDQFCDVLLHFPNGRGLYDLLIGKTPDSPSSSLSPEQLTTCKTAPATSGKTISKSPGENTQPAILHDEDDPETKLSLLDFEKKQVKSFAGEAKLSAALQEYKDKITLHLNGITVDQFEKEKEGFTTVFQAALQVGKDKLTILSSDGTTCVKVIAQLHVKAVIALLLFIFKKERHKALAASLKYLFPSLETIDFAFASYRPRLDVQLISLQELKRVPELKSEDFSSGAMAIIEAVKGEYNAILKAVLNAGASPDAKCAGSFYNWVDECTSAALHHACFLKNVEAVNILIEFKADVNIPNSRGETSLLFGAFKGCLTIVQSLIYAGADVCHQVCSLQQNVVVLPRGRFFVNGCSAFHMASLGGILSVVQEIGEHFKTNVDMPTEDGTTVGSFGALSGSIPVLEYLLKRGCDFRKKNMFLNNSYHHCCFMGNFKTIQWFYEKDLVGDVNETGQGGKTGVLMALSNTSLRAEDKFALLYRAVKEGLLINEMKRKIALSPKNPLHAACLSGPFSAVEYLVNNHGADVHIKDDLGMTPLFLACKSKEDPYRKVKFLADQGADVKAKSCLFGTALTLAASNTSLSDKDMDELIELALKEGLSVNEQTDGHLAHTLFYQGKQFLHKNSPLRSACADGPFSAVKSLVNCDADIHVKYSDGSTPLLVSCMSKEEPYRKVKFLANHGANVKAIDERGYTALHFAAKSKLNGKEEMENLLQYLVVENGMSINAVTKDAESPLHHSCVYGGNFVILQLLVENGSKLEKRDLAGNTPLMSACFSDERYEDFTPSNASKDSYKKVEYLVSHGANLHVTDMMNQNILHLLAEKGFLMPPLLPFLVEKGADVFLKNYNGKRPHELASSEERIFLLSEYTRRSELLRESLLGEKVDLDSMKFSFIGNEMAGKTTLVYALLEMDVSIDPNDRTAGVDLYNAVIPGVGRGSTWDFGAQPTFHGAHGLLFRASNTVFTLVLRFRTGQHTTPERQLLQKGRFWLGFVKAACVVEMPSSSGRERRIKVVIVGNLVGAGEGRIEPSYELTKVTEVLKKDFAATFDIAAVVEMDCSKQKSDCMKKYRAILKELRGQVIDLSSGVPKICKSVEEELQRQETVLKLTEKLGQEIADQFKNIPFYMSVKDFSRWVREEFAFTFEDGVVESIAEYLDFSGVIVRLGDRICLHSFWLCRNVIGPLLSKNYFPLQVQDTDDGLVGKEDVKVALNSFSNDMKHRGMQMVFDVTAQEAIEAFLHLELCYPVEGKPGVYQIPGLVWKPKPEDVWIKDGAIEVYRGFRYKCLHHETDIISPSVFVILHCRCSTLKDCRLEVWKDGFLVMKETLDDIAECLVMRRDDHAAIDIVVRSPISGKEVARELLKEVKEKLEKSCDDRSRGTALDWWCFDSKQLEELRNDLSLYSFQKVSEKARRGKLDGFIFPSSGRRRARVKDLIFQEDYEQSYPKVVERSPLSLSKNSMASSGASMSLPQREDVFPLDSEIVSDNLIKALAEVGAVRWQEIAMSLLSHVECNEIEEQCKSHKARLQAALEAWKTKSENIKVGKILAEFGHCRISRETIERTFKLRFGETDE